MSTLLSAAVGITLVIATAVSLVAWSAYARSRSSRMVLLALAFSSMAVGAGATTVFLYLDRPNAGLVSLSSSMAIGLLLNYWAAVRR